MTLLAMLARPELHNFALSHARGHHDLLSREETVSAADQGLVEACRRFRPERGPFMPFARIWVLREVNRAITLEWRWRRRMVCELDDVEEPLDLQSDGEANVARGEFERILGDESFRLWARHAEDGETLRELARGYQMSLRQIRNRIRTAGASIRFHATGLGESLQMQQLRAAPSRVRRKRRRSGRW
jgi:hypothetical protein